MVNMLPGVEAIENTPSALVMVPVFFPRSITVAPTMGSPCSSVTVPVRARWFTFDDCCCIVLIVPTFATWFGVKDDANMPKGASSSKDDKERCIMCPRLVSCLLFFSI